MTNPTKDSINEVANRLRAARNNAGLSQGQVSKMMGMHRPTISQIEAGIRKVTSTDISQFAKIYDVKVAWILGDAPETMETSDPKLQLAARELGKLKPDDLERLLMLIAAMKEGEDGTAS
ncbi:XRE family transcriptional regulator [Sphingomonadales bacterium EhC05]|nr:XRE family transcriptional regulator [Sphingomonadales bacterium EhC05]